MRWLTAVAALLVPIQLWAGTWIYRDGAEVYHTRVTAQGRDYAEARQQAHRLAIEQAVGALVVSETEVRQNRVQRREILDYSSGFIHDSHVLEQRRQGPDVIVVMDVWVRRSDIADRVLHSSRGSGELPGAQIDLQHETLMAERKAGDRVLETVLRDYPSRAYNITITGISTSSDAYRKLLLTIDIDLSLDPTWLRSFSEALLATATHADAGGCVRNPYLCGWPHVVGIKYREPGKFFIASTDVAYDDHVRAEILKRRLWQPNPHIWVRLHDGHGGVGFQGCFSHNELTYTNYHPARRFVSWREERTVIDGQLRTRPQIVLTVAPGSAQHARKIDVKVVKEADCR